MFFIRASAPVVFHEHFIDKKTRGTASPSRRVGWRSVPRQTSGIPPCRRAQEAKRILFGPVFSAFGRILLDSNYYLCRNSVLDGMLIVKKRIHEEILDVLVCGSVCGRNLLHIRAVGRQTGRRVVGAHSRYGRVPGNGPVSRRYCTVGQYGDARVRSLAAVRPAVGACGKEHRQRADARVCRYARHRARRCRQPDSWPR